MRSLAVLEENEEVLPIINKSEKQEGHQDPRSFLDKFFSGNGAMNIPRANQWPLDNDFSPYKTYLTKPEKIPSYGEKSLYEYSLMDRDPLEKERGIFKTQNSLFHTKNSDTLRNDNPLFKLK